MIWAAVSLLAITAILSSTLVVLVTVQSRRMLERAFRHADSIHERAQQSQASLLDRFMALDFTLFKQYQQIEHADEGEFVLPDPDRPKGGLLTEDIGEFVSRFRSEQDSHEQTLLEEDFPEEMIGGRH